MTRYLSQRLPTLEVKHALASQEGSNGDIYLTNHDLLPVPKENRVWGKWTYSLFWFGECASASSWTVAATAVRAGLSWWEAWICVIFGHALVGIFMVANGRPGGVYHLGFPTLCRASFGVFGSFWPIFNRAVVSMVWTGVHALLTGNAFYVMLHAITPRIADVPNPFSSDVNMTGGRLIGFTIGWVLTLGAASVEFHKYHSVVLVKTGVMLVCLVAFLVWIVVEAGGIGPIVNQGASIPPGQSHAWVFLTQFFIQAANMTTFATNNADLTRYARRPNDTLWTQAIGQPLAFGVIGFFGTFITSASGVILGTTEWDPNLLLDRLLINNYSSSRRAGVFFLGASFAFAGVTSQVFANLIIVGNDTAALLPRYINIRRGAIIALIVAFAMNPWNLMRTSFSFTSYLGAYQIFFSTLIGIMLADYYYVRRGYLHIPDLFSRDHGGLYWYTGGWNWRAYAAYILGILPNMPGFLHQVGVSGIPLGIQRFYTFAMLVGIFVSGGTYILFNHLSPPPGGLEKAWREAENFETIDSRENAEAQSIGDDSKGMEEDGMASVPV